MLAVLVIGDVLAPRRAGAVVVDLEHRQVSHEVIGGDAFQHWVYAQAPEDVRPEHLYAKWAEISACFTPWVDWTGLEAEQSTGWQRQWSLFAQPFYEIAYALSHLGSLQVWRNAWADRAGAWRMYRAALSLGNTRPLPELYAAAGACLSLDRGVVRETVRSVESWLDSALP